MINWTWMNYPAQINFLTCSRDKKILQVYIHSIYAEKLHGTRTDHCDKILQAMSSTDIFVFEFYETNILHILIFILNMYLSALHRIMYGFQSVISTTSLCLFPQSQMMYRIINSLLLYYLMLKTVCCQLLT